MDVPNVSTWYFGEFCLDTDKRLLIHKDGNTVALMPKAFDTLSYLVEHAGEIVDKDELMRAVWTDTIVEENNLSQNISIIRKALGERRGDHRYIVTVPGRGFKFVADVRAAVGESAASASEQAEVLPPPPPRSNKIWLAVTGLLAVSVIALIVYAYVSPRRPTESVAIMPFVNESGDPELDYLSDGMTHALIDNLAKLQSLKVKPRSTVFRYKGRSPDAPTIGRELEVGAVMFGWVTKRGDEVTLRAELVDTQTENSLWSQTYTRKISNLVVLEEELTRNLVRGLSVRLTGPDERSIARQEVKSGEAYQLYLNGQFHFRKLSPPSIAKGIGLLQQAITQDPSYALAYATLARAHIALAIAGEADPSELLKAKAAAQRAVELDEELAEGHSALAVALAFYDWNWQEAENQFRRALELEPNSAPTHQGYGDFLGRMGRREEAAAQMDRALEIEPFSPFMNAFAAISQPDPDVALQRLRFAMELDPDFYLPHLFAAQILVRKQMYAEAIEEVRLSEQLSPAQTLSDAVLASCLVRTGRVDEARGILTELLQRSESRFVSPINIAVVHDHLGEAEQALSMLEKGLEVRVPRITFLKSQPMSASVREHPRYRAVLDRIGL